MCAGVQSAFFKRAIFGPFEAAFNEREAAATGAGPKVPIFFRAMRVIAQKPGRVAGTIAVMPGYADPFASGPGDETLKKAKK
jgi:hypothetical protein